MSFVGFLNGLNSGIGQGMQTSAAMAKAREDAYMAPYRMYGNAMTALYDGLSQPTALTQLKQSLEEARYNFAQSKKLQPLFDARTSYMLKEEARRNALFGQNPYNPQFDAGAAINAELAKYGMGPINANTAGMAPQQKWAIADGWMPEMANRDFAAQQDWYNSNQYPQAQQPKYAGSNIPYMPLWQPAAPAIPAPQAPAQVPPMYGVQTPPATMVPQGNNPNVRKAPPPPAQPTPGASPIGAALNKAAAIATQSVPMLPHAFFASKLFGLSQQNNKTQKEAAK